LIAAPKKTSAAEEKESKRAHLECEARASMKILEEKFAKINRVYHSFSHRQKKASAKLSLLSL
jgi:hypothetical protein